MLAVVVVVMLVVVDARVSIVLGVSSSSSNKEPGEILDNVDMIP